MGHFLGAKKLIFLIRDIDDAAMAGASVESCRFVVLRSPRGRLGSELDVGSRLRRMRGRFDPCIHISKVLFFFGVLDLTFENNPPLRYASIGHDLPKFWIQSSLESTKHRRMRCRRLPDPRPIPERAPKPICIRKK